MDVMSFSQITKRASQLFEANKNIWIGATRDVNTMMAAKSN
jgi:hypothetical protein